MASKDEKTQRYALAITADERGYVFVTFDVDGETFDPTGAGAEESFDDALVGTRNAWKPN